MTKIREIENEIDGLNDLSATLDSVSAHIRNERSHLRAVLFGLRDHVEKQEQRIEALETENAALRARLGGE